MYKSKNVSSDLQTLSVCKYVFKGPKLYCFELQMTLFNFNQMIFHLLIEQGFDSFELRYGNVKKRAWRDKHSNVIVRYTRPKFECQ